MQMLDIDKLKANIEATSRSDIESGRVGGIAVAVMQNGETIYQNCFSDDRLGINVSENTLFRLASMTKPVTTVTVLKLAEQGKITLDDPVYQYIPEYEHMNIGRMNGGKVEIVSQAKRHITIRHILTHTSGLGSGSVGAWVTKQLPTSQRKSLEFNAHYYAQNPLDFEPASQQAYSGSHAFDVLARVAEIASGMHFGELVKKEICNPMEMNDTVFAPSEEQWKRMVPMHDYKDGVGFITEYAKNSVFAGVPVSCCSGGTALASTLNDYKKFADMLLNYGRMGDKQIVGENMIREMIRPQLAENHLDGLENWGLGVRVITNDQRNVLPCGTFGWSGALGGHFWVDPQNRIVAIYLKNS